MKRALRQKDVITDRTYASYRGALYYVHDITGQNLTCCRGFNQ